MVNQENVEIGKRIREVRQKNNLSQEAFGNKLGVTGTAISRIESGDRRLTSQMTTSICRTFNVSLLWLLDGIGEPREILTVGNELAMYMGDILRENDPERLQAALIVMRLIYEDWDLVSQLIEKAKSYINNHFDDD